MKQFFLIAIAILSIFTIACKNETIKPIDETEGLTLLQEMSNDSSSIELYTTQTGNLTVGYNDIYLRIKNKSTGNYITDANLTWMPMMHMISMSHSGPKSNISKVSGKNTLYKGYIVFQMPENDVEKWTLTVNVMRNGDTAVLTDTIAVKSATDTRKKVVSFTGNDGKKYILALANPQVPFIGINDFSVALFKRESMLSFPAVTDATILFDPRMPSMDNHSSPNNVQPTFSAIDNLYHGQLSLSMSGYWKLNFIVKDATDTVIKGEAISDTTESSSLFLEVEF